MTLSKAREYRSMAGKRVYDKSSSRMGSYKGGNISKEAFYLIFHDIIVQLRLKMKLQLKTNYLQRMIPAGLSITPDSYMMAKSIWLFELSQAFRARYIYP